jgi:hypothetical protein
MLEFRSLRILFIRVRSASGGRYAAMRHERVPYCSNLLLHDARKPDRPNRSRRRCYRCRPCTLGMMVTRCATLLSDLPTSLFHTVLKVVDQVFKVHLS